MSEQPSLFLDESYPEVLADIARTIHHELMNDQRVRVPHPIAAEIALKVAEEVRRKNGGVATYIPRGMLYEMSRRDRQMWSEFTGDNYAVLAHKYDMTEMRVRQIMAKLVQVDRMTRQQNLFENPEIDKNAP